MKSALTAIAFVLTTGAAGAAIEACSAEGGSGTTGKRVKLSTRVLGEDRARAPFKNSVGWTVTLSKAHVSTGPLYYFDGDPIFSRVQRPLDRLRGVFLPRLAHAHPGHYVAGNAKGEMTTPSSVDLLGPPNALAAGSGVSGPYRSARFTYASPARGPFATQLGNHAVVVEGSATDGTKTVKFRSSADLGDLLDSYNEPKLEGCVFSPAEVSGDGTVTVTVLPSVWFDQVDFVDLASDGSTVELAGTAAFNGLTRGLKKGTAYVFSYAAN